jgi:hypothetical protein
MLGPARARTWPRVALAVVVAMTATAVLAACGGSSSARTASARPPAGSTAYVRKADAICRRAALETRAVTARVRSAGPRASLADVRAVVDATARVRAELARLTPPRALRSAHAAMLAVYGRVVARLRHDLVEHGRALFSGIYADQALSALGRRLGRSWQSLGLTACSSTGSS